MGQLCTFCGIGALEMCWRVLCTLCFVGEYFVGLDNTTSPRPVTVTLTEVTGHEVTPRTGRHLTFPRFGQFRSYFWQILKMECLRDSVGTEYSSREVFQAGPTYYQVLVVTVVNGKFCQFSVNVGTCTSKVCMVYAISKAKQISEARLINKKYSSSAKTTVQSEN
jgi:hypothetical protein